MKFSKGRFCSEVNTWDARKKDKKIGVYIKFGIVEREIEKYALFISYDIREPDYHGNRVIKDTVYYFKSDDNGIFFKSLEEAIQYSEDWAEEYFEV
jgi:hypothetical protein